MVTALCILAVAILALVLVGVCINIGNGDILPLITDTTGVLLRCIVAVIEFAAKINE